MALHLHSSLGTRKALGEFIPVRRMKEICLKRNLLRRAVASLVLAFTILTVLHSQALHQGQSNSPFSQIRILFDTQVGDYSGLGFSAPYLGWALAVELPFGPSVRDFEIPGSERRFEYQPSIGFSFDTKTFAKTGYDLSANNEGIIWIDHRFAGEGGYGYTAYSAAIDPKAAYGETTSYTLHQSEWVPNVGAVIRDTLHRQPGRLYVDYLFATGCQWATQSNPCTIQSSRTHGIDVIQEIRIRSFLRVAAEVAVVEYYDQSNENEPSIPRTQHIVPFGTVHIALEWPGVPIRSGISY